MKDFYLTLLSDSCLDTFPKDKQSSFTVRLEHPIQIDKENWELLWQKSSHQQKF